MSGGHHIVCRACGGAGAIQRFHEHPYPDECVQCAGSGVNWQYPNGSVAAWQGGPFVGGVFVPAKKVPPEVA